MRNQNLIDNRIEMEPYWVSPWQFFFSMYEITHWMPLPESPERDEGGRYK